MISQILANPVDLNDYFTLYSPWEILSFNNDNLYPSVVKDFFNKDDQARFHVTNDFILGHLYQYGTPSYWCLGSRSILTTNVIDEAITIAKQSDPDFRGFRLISEANLGRISDDPTKYTLAPDSPSTYPYIYKIADAATMIGSKYESARRQTLKFLGLYTNGLEIVIHESLETLYHKQAVTLDLFAAWVEFGAHNETNIAEEIAAFKNFISNLRTSAYRKPLVIELYYRGSLVALSVNDLVEGSAAINLYHFCNLNLTGVSYFLFNLCAKVLQKKEISYLNFQEDCGAEGLRAFKLRMNPFYINKLYRLDI